MNHVTILHRNLREFLVKIVGISYTYERQATPGAGVGTASA
jgi:hypothetical protein